MNAERIYIYKRYERFWHWSQALLVITMLISGFEVHGSYTLLGFEPAVRLHTLAAWALLTLWAFTIFWQFTTGEWRQYLPTHRKVVAMAVYYSWGMFRGAPHPFRKTAQKKHNPLQRLAYLALLAMISPLIWGSGLLYLFRAFWSPLGIDRWLTLEWQDVEAMIAFFQRHGRWVIFVLRFSPLMRTMISLPAGLAHMGRVQFLIYTMAGTTIWNIILIGAGYYLGNNFTEVEKYTGPVTVATIAVIVAAYVWRVIRWQPRA